MPHSSRTAIPLRTKSPTSIYPSSIPLEFTRIVLLRGLLIRLRAIFRRSICSSNPLIQFVRHWSWTQSRRGRPESLSCAVLGTRVILGNSLRLACLLLALSSTQANQIHWVTRWWTRLSLHQFLSQLPRQKVTGTVTLRPFLARGASSILARAVLLDMPPQRTSIPAISPRPLISPSLPM
jgi:hypothetical protein